MKASRRSQRDLEKRLAQLEEAATGGGPSMLKTEQLVFLAGLYQKYPASLGRRRFSKITDEEFRQLGRILLVESATMQEVLAELIRREKNHDAVIDRVLLSKLARLTNEDKDAMWRIVDRYTGDRLTPEVLRAMSPEDFAAFDAITAKAFGRGFWGSWGRP